MKRQGLSYRKIAKELNIKNHSSLYDELNRFEKELEEKGEQIHTIFDFII